MKKALPSISASVALACLLASLAIAPAGHAGKGEAKTQIDMQNDGIGLAFSTHSAHDLASLNVTISSSDGDIVFEGRSDTPILEWVPEAKLADGRYDWHARVVTITPGAPQIDPVRETRAKNRDLGSSAQPGSRSLQWSAADESAPVMTERLYAEKHKQVQQASGAFRVQGGILVDSLSIDAKSKPVDEPDADSANISTKGTQHDDFVTLNDTGTDNNTRVNFFNSTSGNDMSIQNRSGILKIMEGTGIGAVDSDTRLAIRDSVSWVGIGTDSPVAELHIVDSTPQIRLEDSSDSQNWYVENTNSTRFEIHTNFSYPHGGDPACDPSNCSSIPFTIEAPTTDSHASAQDGALYIDLVGRVGLGTDDPLDPLHIADSTPVIRFEDTRDGNTWKLFGASSSFFLQDLTNGNNPFAVQRNAGHAALWVAEGGNVGLGTAFPERKLHLETDTLGDGIRIKNTSSTFSTVWDISADAFAGISFRDMETGNGVMRLRKGAPSESLVIAGTPSSVAPGNVGLGTAAPATPLHVQRSDGSAGVLVQETSATTAARELFKLSNNGGPFFVFENTDIAQSYAFAMGATGHFLLSHQQTSGVQMRLTPAGNLTISGSLSEGSSREIKDAITPVDPDTLLAKLDALPVSEWSYQDVPGSRHVGPMAEDFHATFGLGPDERHIAPRDLAGVALAAAKALKAESQSKDRRIAELERQNRKLGDRLAQIESRLGLNEQ